MISTGATRADGPAVFVDGRLGNGETESQSSVASGDHVFALRERLEYPGKNMGLDADSIVGDRDKNAVGSLSAWTLRSFRRTP